jgi:hypothetical protein
MSLTLNTAQFALTDGTSAQFTVSVSAKPQIMRLVLLCTTNDADSGFDVGDEVDCFGIWQSAYSCCPFSCGYDNGTSKANLNYDGALGSSSNYMSLSFTSFSHFSLKVYYY